MKEININKITLTKTDPPARRKMTLSKEDVWGDYTKGTRGMIIARYGDICPVFNDKIPYKSVTVVCPKSKYNEVTYWLDYVLGGNCISEECDMPDDKIAIRANYMCW